MKKIVVLLLGIVLLNGAVFAEGASEADQKWLAIVEKMVSQGKNEIATASEARLDLVKNWAANNGYKAEVKKTEQGFQVTLAKNLAQK